MAEPGSVSAEANEDVVAVAGDLAGGQGCDPGHVLARQQDQAPGDAVGGLEAVVVEQPGGLVPALLGADRGSGVTRWARDVENVAVALPGGPGQEVAGVAGGGSGGKPAVNINLAAAGETAAAHGQPGKESSRGLDPQPGVGGVGARPAAGGGGAAAASRARSRKHAQSADTHQPRWPFDHHAADRGSVADIRPLFQIACALATSAASVVICVHRAPSRSWTSTRP